MLMKTSGDRAPATPPIERHGYRAPASRRLFAGIGTATIFTLILATALAKLDQAHQHARMPAPLEVSLLPETPPPAAPVEQAIRRPPRQPLARPEATPTPVAPLLAARSPVPVAVAIAPVSASVATPRAADPAPAPPAPPAPPVRHGPDRWEGRVLARLQRFRFYPAAAQRARQQGVAYLRFRIDRGGHVLGASVDQSSGVAALDAAALETLHRADPLPKVPDDRPDPVELVVPVEYALPR